MHGRTTEEELDLPPQVDIQANPIVVVLYSTGGTCNDIPVHGAVFDRDGQLEVRGKFALRDGTCPEVCDSKGHTMLVLRLHDVDPEQTPAVCREVTATCEQ